jgi:hypothetical protein
MYDSKEILRYFSEYENTINPLPYIYPPSNNEDFDALRKYIKLDLKNKSNLEKVHILLNYTFKNLISGNDNYSTIRNKCNSLFILNATKTSAIKSNCYMYCVVLTELLLCYGIKSRLVICRPFDFYKNTDCHCMVHAYIKELHKWIALDPANCASFRDEDGNFISIPEIRKKIIENKTYSIFCSTKNNSLMIKNYLPYYLFAFFSFEINNFNSYASSTPNAINVLLPSLFKNNDINIPNMNITYNEISFWNN